ncbi:Zinc finger CCCH domain-containing protein 17 [Hirschfeldia incana]|nr:Zinc finger CCCH domain-containing protein 17 [Hirschfeldia incana]
MFAPTIPQQQKQPQQSEPASSSAEDEALKWNTDCVYFLASPLTCKKGAECEYRHSEYARMNPRDCYYWLSGNCLNPKCGFRHPPLEAPPAGGSVQPPHATPAHPGVVKQPVPCVFFQKGVCAKGDMCSFMHAPPNPAGYRKQLPVEAKPAADDPRFSKKPVENYTGEKKLPDATNIPKAVAAPRVASSGRVEERYEPVVQKKVVGFPSSTDGNHSTQLHNSSFHNGKDADEGMRESSPGFNVLVDNEAGDSEYYHVEDGYGRRSQERRNEYDPDFIALADEDGEWRRRQHRVSSERGDRSGKRVYGEDERSENIQASDLRYRLAKQRKVGSHDDDNDSLRERGYRDSRRNAPRESSVSSSRLQGRIKLRERSNGDEAQFDRRSERGMERNERERERSERGRERSEFSQGRLRDRIKGRLEEKRSGDQERDLRAAPWARRREMEDEGRRSESKSSRREESNTGTSLGKRKSLEDDHPHKPSGDSFAAPLPFSEILKRKRAAASGGVNSNNNKDQTREETMISKEEAGDETKLVTDEKTEVVVEPKPVHLEEAEVEEGTIQVEGEEEEVYEGNEEDQAYEGDGVNEEYYYEEGYEEGGEYAYEEGEEVVYAAEEAEGEEVVYAAEEAAEGEEVVYAAEEAAEGEED